MALQNNWNLLLGDGSGYGIPGWGNAELECYTANAANAAIQTDPSDAGNGFLAITALSQPNYECSNFNAPTTRREWTSAKLTTGGKQSFLWPASPNASVLIEAKIKIPIASGTWPAFWMLPEPNAYGGWPSSGVIDIMEHVNTNGNVYGTLHFGGPNQESVGGESVGLSEGLVALVKVSLSAPQSVKNMNPVHRRQQGPRPSRHLGLAHLWSAMVIPIDLIHD